MINLDEVRLRAERAEYVVDRITDMVEELSTSTEDPFFQGYIGGLAQTIANMGSTLYVEHVKDSSRGFDVCLTCPRNEAGYHVAWDHLHPRG